MYTIEREIEKIKRFISEKEDDIKYLKEKLAKLLNEDIDKKEINENDDLFEKINAPWKTSFNRIIYSCFSEEIPQKIKDFVSFDNNILNKVIEKYKNLPTKEDSENLNGKTFDDKKQYQNDKDTKFCRWIHFKKDQKHFSIYMNRFISFKGSKSKHAGEICWRLIQYKN